MSEIKISTLQGNITTAFIKTEQFKTARISVNFVVPLSEFTVSANALLPFLLGRCSKDYPDYSALNARLSELYGASLTADSQKIGDTQLIRLTLTALEDKFTLYSESISSECANLLTSLIFDPPLVNGTFNQDDFLSEQRLFIERIASEINDKKRYAASRCEAIMCKGDPYAVPKLGTIQAAQALSPNDMLTAWKRILANSFVIINYIGNSNPAEIFAGINAAFLKIERKNIMQLENKKLAGKDVFEEVIERMDVTQGKLSIGFTTNSSSDSDAVALRVMTDLFGGGTYSRLFQNVREKLSLCYYCSAQLNRRKGFISVNAGVEEVNFKKAIDEILRQLDVLKEGNFEESELSASKMSLIDAANTVLDSASSAEDWYTQRMFDEVLLSPSEFANEVKKVTKDDVIRVAKNIKLDTIFKLAGLEEAK